METTTETELTTASYTIKAKEHKARIEEMARKEILNASIIMRRILDAYFSQLDAEVDDFDQSPKRTNHKPTKKVTA